MSLQAIATSWGNYEHRVANARDQRNLAKLWMRLANGTVIFRTKVKVKFHQIKTYGQCWNQWPNIPLKIRAQPTSFFRTLFCKDWGIKIFSRSSFCLKERRALRLVPVSGIDRENLILLYSRNWNCFIDELMSILSFPAAKHIRRILYIALRHWLEGSSKFLVRLTSIYWFSGTLSITA